MASSESRRGRACAARVILALGLVWGNPALSSPQLRLVDALRMALSGNPDLKVQQTVAEAARGQQLQASGQFDVMLSSGVNYSKLISPSPVGGVDQQQAFTTGYRVGAVKQLRSGASVGAALDANSYLDSALAGAQQPNRVALGLNLNLPLLRGRGAREVQAAEDAAILSVQASELTLRDVAAQTLYRTLSAYWTYSIRLAQEKVTLDSEQRSRELFASTQKLVEASERPRADLVLLQADLADRMAARQAAGLALSEARNTLGGLLGLDAAAIATLAAPADALPAVLDIGVPAEAALLRLHAAALARRPDLLALAARGTAAERQAQAAHLQLRPVLDLEVGVSYAKVSDSGRHFPYIGNVGQLQRGPSVTARLNYQFPLQNTTARGVVRERDAVLDQLTIQRHDLATAVASGVDLALQSLASNAAQLKVAQEALSLYEQAVRQEIIKQRNGISTLIDVINIETRFINARTSYLQTQLAYANAIARLRFETGTLLPAATPGADGARFELDPAELAGLGPIAGELVPRYPLTR
jgi:outer membrane protein TolC